MIVPDRGVARDRIDRWFRDREVTPNVWAQVAGNEAIVSMVSLGDGVGVVPQIVLENSPLAERVRMLEISPRLAPLEVGLFVLQRGLSNPLIAALWDAASVSHYNAVTWVAHASDTSFNAQPQAPAQRSATKPAPAAGR